MKELATKYNPHETEDKWYAYWMEHKLFRSVPDAREPYTIVIPPPNVTGVLHMGHMLNNTIQDVLVRRARMMGKNACWLPGTDHASIATEAKVVDKLKKEGINKSELTRDEFLKHAWEWKEKHGGIILEQLKKLGASCDWERTKFTMDDALSESVIQVFIDLYRKGLIYRGVRMVNWDPAALTALSDEEVIYREVQSKLYYVKYKIVDADDEWVTIATTRPETILGDTAVCYNPNDARFKHLKGKKVIIPLVNRVVPMIEDEYVDIEFGTGCLKITPAHDMNDYEIGIKHHLPSIDIFNDNGTMSEKAGLYIGLDRFEVRDLIVKDLQHLGQIVKIEDYTNKVGYSERTHVVIEPKLSLQWFLKMKKLSEPALENVMNDNIQIIPAKFKNTYRHWMETVHDWCISRQLWWGQRIPAFYEPNGSFAVAFTKDEAYKELKAKYPDLKMEDLSQDEDVLDTWFSSWLWPISVFDGIRNPDNADINYYYPTTDLITGPDILFFWVARMIIAGYEYRNEKPFSNIYLTGTVRDKLGRKMSKSLGNSPDPLHLIEQYGADGVRVGMLLTSPAGNDLPFDESLVEQGRNFGNKIWNAFRLVMSWQISDTIEQPVSSKAAIEWFDAKLHKTIETINEQFNTYRLSEALMEVYKLFWDEFSSWYLEVIKPAYQMPMDKITFDATTIFFDKLLRLLHPFMPFITEELWQAITERGAIESIMLASMPAVEKYDDALIAKFEDVKEIIAAIRSVRKDKNIPMKEQLSLKYRIGKDTNHSIETGNMAAVISKSCNLSAIEGVDAKVDAAVSFMVKTTEYFIPLGNLLNVDEEIKKLNEELKYNEGFLASVIKKLSNEKFVANAKQEIVQIELNKKADAEMKIKALQERIESLKK